MEALSRTQTFSDRPSYSRKRLWVLRLALSTCQKALIDKAAAAVIAAPPEPDGGSQSLEIAQLLAQHNR